MKKLLALILALALTLTFAACGAANEEKNEEDTTTGGASQSVAKPLPEVEPEASGNTEEPDTTGTIDEPDTTEKPDITEEPDTTEAPEVPDTTETPDTTEEPEPEPSGTANVPVADPNNVFISSTNYAEDPNNVSVKPYRVYWENGYMVAECFVINGLDKPVYNIEVKSLSFANQTVDIASASFGVLNDLVIPAHSHVVWTFNFGADCIITPNADLSFLSTDAHTSYYY